MRTIITFLPDRPCPVPENHLIAKASRKTNLRQTPLLNLQPQPAILPYLLLGFQPPAGFALDAALMRTGITTRRSPPPSQSRHQQRRASQPHNEQRTMAAPTSSFPSRPALTSPSESSTGQSATPDVEEAIEYSPVRSPPADSEGPGPESGVGQAQGHNQSQGPGVPRTRSVQFSTPAAGMASSASAGEERINGGGGHGERHTAAESSGDEITPMVSRERGGGKGYDATAASNSNSKPGDNVRSSSQGSAGSGVRRRAEKKRRGSKGSRGSGPGPDDREGDEEEEGGWWARTLEKFGSVELDNKGSVARDHLALGMFVSSSPSCNVESRKCKPIIPFLDFTLSRLCIQPCSPFYELYSFSPQLKSIKLVRWHRTHLPRLAPYLPCIRLHRHSHNATLPPQHHDLEARRSKARRPIRQLPSTPAREAARSYIPGYSHPRSGNRWEAVF